MSELIIYQQQSNGVEIYLEEETLWLNLGQIADLFGVNKPAISKHLKTIFESGELEKEATVSKKETVQKEGERFVQRTIDHYNLDAILSVGYRVNSGQATKFRIWATNILREHLTREWTRNQRRIANMVHKLESVLETTSGSTSTFRAFPDECRETRKVISRYSRTFQLLHSYETDLLPTPSQGREMKLPDIHAVRKHIAILKDHLLKRNEVSELFGQEREGILTAILKNQVQPLSVDPVHPDPEARAVHLFYSVIKKRPFIEGNKRIAAFLLANFLQLNKCSLPTGDDPILNDIGLTALTLLIAQSEPAARERMIRLTKNMITSKTPDPMGGNILL